MQQRFRFLGQTEVIAAAARRIQVDQKIDIAVGPLLAVCHRTAQPKVAGAVSGGDL